MNKDHLSYAQCLVAVQNAQTRFAALRKKYPKMKAYLVIALRGEQADNIDDWESVLRQYPTLITGGADAKELHHLLKKKLPQDISFEELKHHKERFHELAQTTTYRADALIELRFHDLDYPLLDQLRQDPLVDQTLTPKTRASILIVLGAIKVFFDQTR